VLALKSDKNGVVETLGHLSNLLRVTFDTKRAQKITLASELEFLDEYLAIQRLSLGDRLSVHREIGDEVLSALVPSMLLQPVVENAIVHGIARQQGPGTIVVAASRGDGMLHLRVSDSGPGFCQTQHRDGVGLLYSNVRNGERVSAARGYLHPVLHRTGLTVLTGATVRRVVIHNHAVTGVEYTDAEGRRKIAQSPSVVVCAGGLRTPHLLMLSGIGPADELAAQGIEVVTDLPGVGHNLQDHPIVSVGWPVTRGETWADATSPKNSERYATSRRGPLASIGQAAAFLRCGRASSIRFLDWRVERPRREWKTGRHQQHQARDWGLRSP